MLQTIAFDIDGTLTENWFLKTDYQKTINLIKKSRYDFNSRNILNAELSKLKCTLLPLMPIIIITNRPLWLAQITNTWINFHNIRTINNIFANDVYQGDKRIKYKSTVLNELRIQNYVEDEEEIRKSLKKNCPNTAIFSPLEAIEMGLATIIGGN